MHIRRWILIFLTTALLCIGALVIQSAHLRTNVVSICQNGEELYRIDLSTVDTPYCLTIPFGEHYNLVQVTSQTVTVISADCSNQLCVSHGPLTKDGLPITCLPHHLSISWLNGGFDA